LFTDYFENLWLSRVHLWARPWRRDATFHTSNLIESYHNQLKTYYLGRVRSLRVDRLVYLLSSVVTLDYQQESVRVKFGIQSSRLSKAEEKKTKIGLSN
ncbi:hypothetical protein MBANPS3_000755, partial [Mucor bainieri]